MKMIPMHNENGGVVGWLCTSFLFVINMITPQDWSYIMAGVAAGGTAFYYIAKGISVINKKDEPGDK